MDYTYKFPVVKGIQAQSEYYIAMVPLRMLPKLFYSEEEYVLPEFRAQRRLNETRIPTISKYITDNRSSYVFSALAASIDGDFSFIASKENNDLGVLEVSMDARFLINDGQHRKAAILEALKEDETLGQETIPVVFFADDGLARSQQIFTDLNKHAVKTSNSISELYDSRDDLAVLTRDVVSKVEFLNRFTDKEKDILGKYSSNLFTLNNYYQANKRILGRNRVKAKDYDFLLHFWSLIAENITEWNELINKEITKKDLRENYIVTQNVVLQALGRVGKHFYDHDELLMEDYLPHLVHVDWSRTNNDWFLRTINTNGKVITNQKAIMLTGNVIKKVIGLPLTPEEQKKENEFLKERGMLA